MSEQPTEEFEEGCKDNDADYGRVGCLLPTGDSADMGASDEEDENGEE